MRTKIHGLRVGVSAAMLGAILSTGAASANQLTLTYGTPGRFLATSDDGWSATTAANYIPQARGTYNNILGVGTFCLEKDEYFRPGNGYNYQVNGSASALNGGRNTPDDGTGSDHLSVASGFLGKMFATGGLAGYNYGSDSQTRDLQNAFWTLEEEQPTDIATWLQDMLRGEFGDASSLTDWRADFGNSLTSGTVMSATTYGVDVINLGLASNRYSKQDQIVYIGTPAIQRVPDGGTTFALMGITLGAIGAVRRKMART